MKLKKVILMVSLVAVFGLGFMFNTSTAQAQTTMVELQALIANLQVQIAQLQKQLVELQKAPAVWCYDFNITLKYGDTGEEVKALQTAFLKQGFLSDKEIAAESDYFGESMAAAVVDFQLKYKDEISKYAGYSIRASGVFGKGTRTKLNEIYGCGVVQPICTQRDESCCLGDRCSIAEILCPTGTTPVFKGCDVNCKPRKECQPSTPSITILSPNGGEQFNQGTALAIKWSLGGINPINIDLLDYGRKQEDGSTPFVLNIAHNNPSLKGALVWNIPSDWPTGNLYKIRISENTKAGAQDESDNYFSIVTCVRETTKAGVTCGGYFYEDYCENLSDGTGYANKRKCNASTGTDCSSLVNVDRTYCPYGCQNGVCKSVPSITVAVLSPNGGEQWQVGKTYSVTWKSSGLEQININLLSADPVNEGSYRVARLISNLSASIGNYSWAVPEKTECLSLPCITLPEHRNHKIEVVDARYGRNSSVSKVYSDTSDAPFSIVTAGTNLAPVIDGVTAPTQLKVNEQGTWTINARDPENGPLTYSVRWGDEVLSLTTEQRAFSVGGTASQITTFTHTYNKTGTYTINFTVTDDHQQTAKTSTTIEVVATTPSLTVISPNGGETWERGKTYTISWIGSDVFKEITIGLTNYENYEGGGRGIPAAMHIGTFGGQTRAYGWEITPDIVPGGKYKIRVDGDKFDGTKITDDADNYLSIVSAASTF